MKLSPSEKPDRYLFLDFLVLLLYVKNYAGKTFGLLEFSGLLIGIISYILWTISRVQLGKNFSALPKAQGLVTHGLHSKIRNPIYFFSSLCLFGAALPSKSAVQYFLLTILVIIQIYRASKEEAVLEEKFGQKYLEYKSKAWF